MSILDKVLKWKRMGLSLYKEAPLRVKLSVWLLLPTFCFISCLLFSVFYVLAFCLVLFLKGLLEGNICFWVVLLCITFYGAGYVIADWFDERDNLKYEEKEVIS